MVTRSPVIPLVIRTNVFFSLIALALGSSIFKAITTLAGRSSPTLDVVVDAIALVHVLFITYGFSQSRSVMSGKASAQHGTCLCHKADDP